MRVKISTTLNATEDEMWERLQKVSSLMYVASPILTFKPANESPLSEKWETKRMYKLKLFLFGLIPLGAHNIELVEINRTKNRIVSKEHGKLAREWNHIIWFQKIDGNKLHYTDEIEIKAGLITVVVWLFAHVFYRHRQRRWKRLFNR